MSAPIEKWARQATLLDGPPKRVKEDINDLMRYETQFWHRMNRELRKEDTALESFFGGLLANPPGSALPTVTPAATTDTLLWTPATWTPLPANTLIAPEVMRVAATWSTVYAATAGTTTYTPRIGTTAAGITMGAGAAITGTNSATAHYYLLGDMTIRTIGGTTTSGTAIGLFHLYGKLSGTGVIDINQIMGHTVATFDPTAAQGFALTVNNSVATQVFTVQQIHWMSWN